MTLMKLKVIILTIVAFVLVSCTATIDLKTAGFKKSFEVAKKNFKKEYYLQSVEDCNVIMLNYAGTEGIDSVQFLIGESHYKLGEFYSASFEYMRLVDNYPESKLSEESLYKSALCYYKLAPQPVLEQKETKTAVSKFQNFLDRYQKGKYAELSLKYVKELRSKLAEKDYKSGILYVKMDQPRAAIIYFKSVLDNYYDTKYLGKSYKGLSDAYKLMKDNYNYRVYLKKFEESSESKN